MWIIQQGIIVAGMLALPASPGAPLPGVGAPAVHAPRAAATLLAEQERLRARFVPLARAAVGSATDRDRAAFVQFVRTELVDYLTKEGTIVYPLTDSIAGTGGYVTTTAILEQDAIGRLVNCLDAGAGSGDAAAFAGCAYGLAEIVDAHFVKDRILTVPILKNGLSERDMERLVAEMEGAPPMAFTR
jgi:hypothetical protein